MKREKNKALTVPPELSGLSINVRDDGTWICLKASSGRTMCFQPIQKLFPNEEGIISLCVREWCNDMQNLYESSEIINRG